MALSLFLKCATATSFSHVPMCGGTVSWREQKIKLILCFFANTKSALLWLHGRAGAQNICPYPSSSSSMALLTWREDHMIKYPRHRYLGSKDIFKLPLSHLSIGLLWRFENAFLHKSLLSKSLFTEVLPLPLLFLSLEKER